MNGKYEALFQPMKIGETTIKNRIILCAMGGTALIENGKFNETPREFFLNCARSGVGLIIPGLCIVTDKWGRGGWLDEAEEAFRGPLKEYMSEIHQSGAKLFLQLSAGMGRGLRANAGIKMKDFNYEKAMVAPSDGLPNAFVPELKHRALTREEIQKMVDVLIHSAVLAKEADCDGVEIHAVHEGYLLDQFAIANTNFRTDEYGGSLENRMRFTTDIISGIKRECGKDFPVLVRYSVASKTRGFNQSVLPGQEYVEFGRSLEESVSVVRQLAEAGCDGLDADNGSFDSWHWAHPPVYLHDGCNLPEAAYIKYFSNIPVIVSGRMGDPDIALKAVESGAVDAVALARPFLADSEWCSKVKNGDVDNIRPCISCHSGCFARLTSGLNVSCALNPVSLQEEKYRISPADVMKKVIVVGGGVGGMEAARLCAIRGLDVTIYEKTNSLGGVFTAASAPDFKEADKKLLRWYEKQLVDLDIKVHLNAIVDNDLIRREKADVVIVATGAVNRKLPIPGFKKEIVCDALDYLLNRRKIGDNVVVVGGGLTGCEVAYDVARHGKKVSVVEMLPDILQVPGLCKVNSDMLRDLLSFHNVDVYTAACVTEILDNSVAISTIDGNKNIPADNVIIAVGYEPSPLQVDMPGCEVYTIGDAEQVGNLLSVIWSAYDVVLSL